MADATAAQNAAAAEGGDAEKSKEWKVGPEEELRVEVPGGKGKECTVELLQGGAELFGSPLAVGQKYLLRAGEKAAVFSWKGCTLKLSGDARAPYVAGDTPMAKYRATHYALEKMRKEPQNDRGPVTLVVGPTDSGKSTLTQILANYAVSGGWKPVVVDLDVGQNDISIPGVVAAVPWDRPSITTKVFGLGLTYPICYFYGHTSPHEGGTHHYMQLVGRLQQTVQERLTARKDARHAGLLINTCGWVSGEGFDLVIHAAQTFKADVIVVVGDDRLWSLIKSDDRIRAMSVYVDKLPKSGGVVARDPVERRMSRMQRIRDYFYGVGNTLRPNQRTLNFSQVRIFRAGGAVAAPAHTLPIGAAPTLDPNRMVRLELSQELVNLVLGVSFATKEDDARLKNVAGYVHVVAVDVGRGSITILAPCPGPLPSNIFLAGSLKFVE